MDGGIARKLTEVRVVATVVHLHTVCCVHNIVVDVIEAAAVVSIEALRPAVCSEHAHQKPLSVGFKTA